MKEAKLWKYAVSAVLFVVLYVAVPFAVSLLWKLTEVFTPKYFQSTAEWVDLASKAIAPWLIVGIVNKIVGDKHRFCMVLMIIGAFYSVFVATWNYCAGVTDAFQAITMAAMAISYAVCAVSEGKKGVAAKQ